MGRRYVAGKGWVYDKPKRTSADNTGDITVNTDGGVSMGLGSGLAIDLTDGSLGVQTGGVTIDFDSN